MQGRRRYALDRGADLDRLMDTADDILVALGKRRVAGGQEDMIVDVALGLLQQRD